MNVAKNILEDLVNEISFSGEVFQVDSEPKPDGAGGYYLDIDTEDGDTYRLSLSLLPESNEESGNTRQTRECVVCGEKTPMSHATPEWEKRHKHE